MVNEKLFYVGVKGLIKNENGQVLLLKADVSNHRLVAAAYWDVTGGRIEEGQTALDTLAREIQEETGITEIKNPQFFMGVISNHEIPISDTKNGGLVLMVYTVTIPTGSKIVLSPEHTEYEWVEPAEAARRLSNKYPEEFTDALRRGGGGEEER